MGVLLECLYIVNILKHISFVEVVNMIKIIWDIGPEEELTETDFKDMVSMGYKFYAPKLKTPKLKKFNKKNIVDFSNVESILKSGKDKEIVVTLKESFIGVVMDLKV